MYVYIYIYMYIHIYIYTYIYIYIVGGSPAEDALRHHRHIRGLRPSSPLSLFLDLFIVLICCFLHVFRIDFCFRS